MAVVALTAHCSLLTAYLLFPVNQTNHFFDLGYGWLCKHCSAADSERPYQPHQRQSRFFGRAESEKIEAKSSGLPFAGWTDASRHALICPRCGIVETLT
jgi:hypothetical protein